MEKHKYKLKVVYKTLMISDGISEVRCDVYIDKQLKLSCAKNDLEILFETADNLTYQDLIPPKMI